MATAHINIGSNLGDRAALIGRAVAAVEAALGAPARVSSPVESEPWGYESPNRFLNVGISIATDLAPLGLLCVLQRVQRSIDSAPHRNADGSYADRSIDIDLIALGDTVVDTPELTLPHPRMQMREFVLRPLAELEPGWRHPLSGDTACDMLRKLRGL